MGDSMTTSEPVVCSNHLNGCTEHRPHYHVGADLYEWGTTKPIGLPAGPTPDDTAAPDFPPYTYGERRRNPYYKVLREVWRYKDGHPVELMIAKDADVTDIIHAFGLGHDLGEVLAKICRLHLKEGTSTRQEFIKMREHIQAAEDDWVASQEDKT